MPNVLDDIQTASDWIATALSSSGYRADFSPESLWQVDFFFEDHASAGAAVRGGLLAKDLGTRLFGVGAYVGEVVRRARGGEWVAEDGDPEAEVKPTLRLPDGIECWPIQRVLKRFKNGSEDALAAYGLSLGLQVGARPNRTPPARRRPWWWLS